MYKAVSQSVLMYRSDILVVMGSKLKVLEVFHHWAARLITGPIVKRVADGEWEYPLVVAALEATGLHPIPDYIQRWKSTIVEQVACQPIY